MNDAPNGLFRPTPPEIIGHQLALGQLCWSWAWVDRTLNELLAILLGVDEAKVACIATEADNIASRSRLAKRLLYTWKMPSDWNTALERSLNKIENELAPLRNRYIHDSWAFSDGELVRTDRRAFLRKLKAHDSNTLLYDMKHTATPKEMQDLQLGCMFAVFSLKGACRDLEKTQESGQPPAANSLLFATVHTWEDQRSEGGQPSDKTPLQPFG